MPYLMTREISELKLKQGDKLEFEKGKLPAALTFSAAWQEPEPEAEKKPKAKK